MKLERVSSSSSSDDEDDNDDDNDDNDDDDAADDDAAAATAAGDDDNNNGGDDDDAGNILPVCVSKYGVFINKSKSSISRVVLNRSPGQEEQGKGNMEGQAGEEGHQRQHSPPIFQRAHSGLR